MLCFIHIEKAAGTSFHYILKKYIPNYLILKPHPSHGGEFSQKQFKLLVQFFPKIEGLGGHRLRPYLNYDSVTEKKIDYITVLRPPIERYLSHYFHHKRQGFFKEGVEEFMKMQYFDDFMCKKICGESSAKKAIEIINKKNIKILFIEDISHFERKNLGLDKDYSKIAENHYQQLKECNLQDMELYNYLREKGSDFQYFKANILNKEPEEIPKLSSFKIRLIQEVFQRTFYYLSNNSAEKLKPGF